MDSITALTRIDYTSVFISVFIILIGIKAIVSLFEWVIDKLGVETKWMRKQREEHELLIQTSQNLTALQERHVHDMHISDKRDEDWGTFMNYKEEDEALLLDMVCESNEEVRNSLYEKYEKILEENGLENGEVEISMELINDVYKQKLKEGF